MEFKVHLIRAMILAGGIAMAHGQVPLDIDLKGTVNHGVDGKPVAGAAVSLALYPNLSATTDASGKFTLKGSVVGIQASRAMESALPAMAGSTVTFTIGSGAVPVSIDVFDLTSRPVGGILNRELSPGEYRVDAFPVLSRLPSGLYLIRVRTGGRISTFKVSAPGTHGIRQGRGGRATLSRTALAKRSGDEPDTLKVTKAGFRAIRKTIIQYAATIPIILSPKLPAGDVKIYSERDMPQVDWAQNVEVQVWDGATKLNGQYAPHFEGDRSWMAELTDSPGWSGWAFVTKPETPEDLSDWAGGSIHLAVKGTVNSVALTVISEGMPQGSNADVDVSAYGYRPDNEWHEVLVPMSVFEETDLTRVTVYCALVTPAKTDTAAFDPSRFYQIDDLYYTLKK